MRIAIISRIYRPEPATASLFLGSLADALIEAGHEVDVLTAKLPKGVDALPATERVLTFPVFRDRNGYVRGYLQYLSFDIPLAFRILMLRRPDVVFVEPPPTTGAIVRMVCMLRRIPYVYDAADIWSDATTQVTKSKLVVRLLRSVERFALCGAAAVTTISQGVSNRLRELGIWVEAIVTGFGADTEKFSYTPRSIEPLFVYGGTHSEVQGAGILIEAFAAFNKTHPGYRLRFFGNGTDQKAMLQRSIELGIGDSVEFHAPIPPEQLCAQFNSAVASFATLRPDSGYEYAFGTKIYGSFASGCPVIFAGPGPTGDFMRAALADAPVGITLDYEATGITDAMRELADHRLSADDRSHLAEWAARDHSMRSVGAHVASVIIGAASAGKH